MARLSYVSPAVRTQALGQREWYEALPDQPVERSVRVATGAQGGAEIAIGEQLRIQLEPETVVLVRKLPRGARGPSELQLVTGSLLVEIIDGKGIGPLLIRTAVGDVRLRGLRCAWSVMPRGGRRSRFIRAWLRCAADAASWCCRWAWEPWCSRATAMRRCVSSPRLRRGSTAAIGAGAHCAVDGQSARRAARQGELVLNFAPVPGALRYRVEVAADPQLHDRRVLSDINASPLRAELPPGLYYARVTALDSDLLAGLPSATQTLYLVTVRSNAALSAPAMPTRPGGASTIYLQRAQAAILKFDSGTLPLTVQLDGQRSETCRGECVLT